MSKIYYIEIRKQKKNNVILSVANVRHPQLSTHSHLSSCLTQSGEAFPVSWNRFTGRDPPADLFGKVEPTEVSLNPFWQVK
jgi:hypothetical protein